MVTTIEGGEGRTAEPPGNTSGGRLTSQTNDVSAANSALDCDQSIGRPQWALNRV